ncbi:MAG: hypothetical protein JXR76_01530 [Deltaproteobacteria bacterium]|nr:hypothetical protein [Deltaproteobacteria bacterium]
MQEVITTAIFYLGVISVVTACKTEEPECVPSGKVNVVGVEKTPLPSRDLKKARENLDQCHACVYSQHGFYSCQTAWQTRKKESRVELRKMAREKACEDAGYETGKCPDSAIKLVQCKGDKPAKETELTKSFRRLLKNAGKGDSHLIIGRDDIPSEKPTPQETNDSPSAASTDAPVESAPATAKDVPGTGPILE